MIVAPALQQRYNAELLLVQKVEKLVDAALFKFCKQRGFAFSGRIKTVESIAEKIESGRYKDWTAIDDRYACTVVIPNIAEEATVVEFLRSTFRKRSIKVRGESRRSPEHFRFDNTRFYGSIVIPDAAPDARTSPLGEFDTVLNAPAEDLSQITFEVQVRTAFEHAWQVATHPLTYKSDRVDWRRQRLTAQMRAMVEQLDLMVVGFNDLEPHIVPSPDENTATKAEVIEKFLSLQQAGLIPDVVSPKDWGRFADNVTALLRNAGKLRNRDGPLALIDQVERWIRNREPRHFPISISLFQIVVGVASTDPSFCIGRSDYYLALSKEMEMEFPEARRFTSRFVY